MARSSLEKIHALSAIIEGLDGDIDQARAELGMLEHIDSDAQRDAAVTEHAEDTQDARMTASDVTRMKRHIDKLVSKRAKTARKRDATLAKLQAG
jgi:hypothetical protein